MSNWQAFIKDGPARAAAAQRWDELRSQLDEAERLVDDYWKVSDVYPGVIGQHGSDEWREVSVETWAFMHALLRGMGAVSQRNLDRELETF
jgi:hypothetical protein